MKLFLDTEFSSLIAAESKLISIALVAEDGREFYAELTPAHYWASRSPFVMEVVLPLLWGGQSEMSLPELVLKLRAWLTQFDHAKIVNDAPSWDLRFFREAIDEANLGWPANVATSIVLFQPDETLLLPYFDVSGRFPHHALHDARALRSIWSLHNANVKPSISVDHMH